MTDKFIVGKKYGTRATCDHNIIYVIEVTKRTEKTLWFVEDGHNERKTKIHLDEKGVEYIIPERYSMCPVWDANDLLTAPMKPETKAMIDNYYLCVSDGRKGVRNYMSGFLTALYNLGLITAEELDEVLTDVELEHPLED